MTWLNGMHPFVCKKHPFICNELELSKPFIRKKVPFVGYNGFTLIEMVVTLAVAGILITVAVPAFTAFVQSNRLTTVTNDLVADFQLARSEAIKRAVNAVICKSTDSATCTSSGTWASGWVVFADVDGNGAWSQTPGAEDVLIRAHPALPANITFATSPPDIAIFNRQGTVNTSGDFTICNSVIKKARVLSLIGTGRISLAEGTC